MIKRSRARWKREQWDRPSTLSQLEAYVNKPGVFLHLSALGPNQRGKLGDRLGINPQQSSKYNTPLGIYAYPFDNKHFEELQRQDLPFQATQPWVHLFTVNLSKCLIVSRYSHSQFEKDIKRLHALVDHHPDFLQEVEHLKKTSKNKTPAGLIWYVTLMLSRYMPMYRKYIKGRGIGAWTWLLRQLGYQSVWDDSCAGIIHGNEPCQIVVLSTTFLKRILVVPNPSIYGNLSIFKSDGNDKHLKGWHLDEYEYVRSFTDPHFVDPIVYTITWSADFEGFPSRKFYLHVDIDERIEIAIAPNGKESLKSYPFSTPHDAARAALKHLKWLKANLPSRTFPPDLSRWEKIRGNWFAQSHYGDFEIEQVDSRHPEVNLFFYEKGKFHSKYVIDESLRVLLPSAIFSDPKIPSAEEAARVARRLWARWMKDGYKW